MVMGMGMGMGMGTAKDMLWIQTKIGLVWTMKLRRWMTNGIHPKTSDEIVHVRVLYLCMCGPRHVHSCNHIFML